MVNNEKLINDFSILQKYYAKINDKGRSIAYRKLVNILRNLPFEIKNSDNLKGIKGIGKNILKKIDEWLKTGQIQTIEKIKKIPLSEHEQILEKLETVWGIGKKKALDFYKKGVRNISDLYKFWDILTRGQKIGLKYYFNLNEKIPREFIIILEVIIRYYLNKYFGRDTYKFEITGSYRRGKAFSGDVDCLISSEKFTLNDIVTLLKNKGIIVETFSQKFQKFIGIAGCHGDSRKVHIDIQFIKPDEWGSALLYFTGSKEFNMIIRGYVKSKGYRLNEHGIFDKNNICVVKCFQESDIFNFLNIDFIKPNMRD